MSLLNSFPFGGCKMGWLWTGWLKASRVSIEIQKKPSRAFGAMFGNAAGKRKFNPESKAAEEIKVEQIKSFVSLPFQLFTDKTKSIVQETAKPREIPIVPQTTSSEPEKDMILLKSDSDMEEQPANHDVTEQKTEDENNVSIKQKSEDEGNVILLHSDSCSDREEKDGDEHDIEDINEQDGTMSLSDLSTSFQMCVQTADEKRKSNPGAKGGLVKVTPFDYAAARKEVRFGEDGLDGSGGEDGNAAIKRKREKKKSGGRKESAAGERSGDFQLGRRRQAFPASGNRSSTFK